MDEELILENFRSCVVPDEKLVFIMCKDRRKPFDDEWVCTTMKREEVKAFIKYLRKAMKRL